jgi:hypothetical protein
MKDLNMAPTAAPVLEVLAEIVKRWLELTSQRGGPCFGDDLFGRLQHVEASITPLAQYSKQAQAHIVTEVVVTEGSHMSYPAFRLMIEYLLHIDMCNSFDTMHDACITFLVDMYVFS